VAERKLSPSLEALVQSEEFARMGALIGGARRLIGGAANGVTRRLWHLANLPAGSDVQRLRVQIGQLDREVRRLTLQLAAQAERDPGGKLDERV
jgi:hypothetical protein